MGKIDYININREAYDQLAEQYKKRHLNLANDDLSNEYWLEEIAKYTKKDDKVLEIGPGSGRILKIMAELELNITAVELSKEMYKLCKEKVSGPNLILGNILEQTFNEKFKFIYASAVICNFPRADGIELARKIHCWLDDAGVLMIRVSLKEETAEGLFVKNDYEGSIKRFRHFFTQTEFENLFITNGFEIIDTLVQHESSRNKKWLNLVCKKKKQFDEYEM